MSAQIGSDDSTSLKSPVLDATPGKTSRVHITPLSNALIQIDWAYLSADGRTSSEITTRVKDWKKQITDALSNLITEAGLTSASFDFLTDSSFAANTGAGMDRLLDNISVKNVSSNSSETKIEIALKNTTDKAALASTDTDLTNTIKKVTSKNTNDIQSVNPPTPTRVKANFVGDYTVNVTFYSNNGDGSFVPPETKTVKFTVADDYVITCSTEPLTGCTGSLAYDNNVATFTVTKTSGTSSTTLKGSVDNFFKVTATVSSKDTSNNNSTTGNIVGWKNKSSRSNSLQDFAGTYNINVPSLVYRDADKGAIVTTSDSTKYPSSVSGTVSIGSDGKVSSCSIGGFKNCTGGLVLKHKDLSGALFVISAKDNSDSTALWGTFTGSVATDKNVTGAVNARIKDSYKFSGDFTGSPQNTN